MIVIIIIVIIQYCVNFCFIFIQNLLSNYCKPRIVLGILFKLLHIFGSFVLQDFKLIKNNALQSHQKFSLKSMP